MLTVSPNSLLATWERGQGRCTAEQAVVLLALAEPHADEDALLRFSVGERDRRLLLLRQALFGEDVEGVLTCPACRESMEVHFRLEQFLEGRENIDGMVEKCWILEVGDYRLCMRAPTSRDLLDIGGAVVIDGARRLLRCCISSAAREGVAVDFGSLPDDVLFAAEESIAQHEPSAEILLDADCPACRYRWSAPFDIVVYLWMEIAHRSQVLLREIAVLAREYGWEETSILAMSSARRRLYLEMVEA